ncbi:hypothetical protein L0337_07615 [candidate division KSB1 bacterium]|nr:hypothetical protein [candidate division KSB1 bacterium]
MNAQDKNLTAFEEYLFSFMNEATPSTPLTGDEVVAILNNYGPPEEVSAEESEQAVQRMKKAHARRMEVANKMQNPDQINSLGELLQIFCEWKHISPAWLARLLNMSAGHFEAHRQDSVSPEEFGKEQILNFAALAGIGIPTLVIIIERTIKRLQLKSATNWAGGRTRIYQEAISPQNLKIKESAAAERLPQSGEAEETAQPKAGWEALREAILQEAEREALLLSQPHQCLTIHNKSQRQFAQYLLEQI